MPTLSELMGLKPKITMDETWVNMTRTQREKDDPVHHELAMCRGDAGFIYLWSLSPLRFALYSQKTKGIASLVRKLRASERIFEHREMDGEGLIIFSKTALSTVREKFPLLRATRSTSPETTVKRAANARKIRRKSPKVKKKVP